VPPPSGGAGCDHLWPPARPAPVSAAAKDAPAPRNKATFDDIPLGQNVPPIYLIEIPANQTVDDVAKIHKDKQLVTSGHVFIEGKEKLVAVFRART
jgi:hypothetical protein